MNARDEDDFSKAIVAAHPDVKFIHVLPQIGPIPKIHDSISQCICQKANPGNAAIISTNITSLDFYSNNFVVPIDKTEYFYFPSIGPGIIQFLHSRDTHGYEPGGLRNGRLSSSFDPEKDPKTATFSKSIYAICKKGARKLYWIDPKTDTLVNPKPDRLFFAWPGAIEQYDRVNGQYLSNNALAFLTSKI